MTDAVFTVGSQSYDMNYTRLPNKILYNWHNDVYGTLKVYNDRCSYGESKTYTHMGAMIYNSYLYVWLCSNSAYGDVVLKSTTPYTPNNYGTLHCYARTTDGKDVTATVLIEGTNIHDYTPCNFNLKPGTYNLDATWSTQEIKTTVNVYAGSTTNVEFKFKPETVTLYGVKFDWPKDATHVIAYKVYNPLHIPIDKIIADITNFSAQLLNRGWRLIGSHSQMDVQNENGIIVVWLKEEGSVTLVTIAALIVVAVIVGLIVYGWVTAERNNTERTKVYSNTVETEDKRLDEQLKNGLITKEQYTKLVAIKHKTWNPNAGSKNTADIFSDMEKMIGLAVAGGLALTVLGMIRQEGGFSGAYSKAKGEVINIYTAAKRKVPQVYSAMKSKVGQAYQQVRKKIPNIVKR